MKMRCLLVGIALAALSGPAMAGNILPGSGDTVVGSSIHAGFDPVVAAGNLINGTSNPAYFNSDLAMYKNFKFTESRYVQFRFSAFNFLNHPLEQFNADGSGNDLKLSFTNPDKTLSTTNVNTFTTGKPTYKVGSRTVEMALKFVF